MRWLTMLFIHLTEVWIWTSLLRAGSEERKRERRNRAESEVRTPHSALRTPLSALRSTLRTRSLFPANISSVDALY